MNPFDLDTPLITLSTGEGSLRWSIRNAVEGVQIFGGIGSGKTSGSGQMLALKYLSAGLGGLVLTVKPDERKLWEKYCALTGREDDLIVLAPGAGHVFNFLDYEASGVDASMTENIVQVLKTVIRAGEDKAGGKNNDPFWEKSLDMLMSNIIDLCLLAYGTVTITLLYEIAQSIPTANDENWIEDKSRAFTMAFRRAKLNVSEKVYAYQNSLGEEGKEIFCNDPNYQTNICDRVPEARVWVMTEQFFSDNFINLSSRTRSVIDLSLTSFLYSLLREPVYSLLCNGASTFRPEACLAGKIILIDLPVKRFHKVGRDAQVLFKYIWQRAMEKRQIDDSSRPVFLWADEAQNFLHEYDAEYQATARSSRIATVYISQNLPNYHANMGGEKYEFRVKSFLGTLATKIFHANADVDTNRYASELIGDGYFEDTSRTSTAAGQFSSSKTRALKIDRIVRPEEFARLKNGGPLNQSCVEAYMHLQGNLLKDGASHLKVYFHQNFIPHPKTQIQ